MSRSDASAAIDALLALRGQERIVIDAPVSEGMYRHDGEVYKVQRSQAGRLYAKHLTPFGGHRLVDATGDVVGFEFQYEPGAIARLSASDLLTLDEAKQFGLRYGFCCVCGDRLSDAKSVAQGIGPVCIKRFAR
jgi:hypothetical protein